MFFSFERGRKLCKYAVIYRRGKGKIIKVAAAARRVTCSAETTDDALSFEKNIIIDGNFYESVEKRKG